MNIAMDPKAKEKHLTQIQELKKYVEKCRKKLKVLNLSVGKQ